MRRAQPCSRSRSKCSRATSKAHSSGGSGRAQGTSVHEPRPLGRRSRPFAAASAPNVRPLCRTDWHSHLLFRSSFQHRGLRIWMTARAAFARHVAGHLASCLPACLLCCLFSARSWTPDFPSPAQRCADDGCLFFVLIF